MQQTNIYCLLPCQNLVPKLPTMPPDRLRFEFVMPVIFKMGSVALCQGVQEKFSDSLILII